MRPPRETHGFTVGDSQIRKRYGITVIGVKPPGRPFEYATEQTRIDADDVLILSGDTMLLEKFARRP
ncbi:MAG: TrkA C-terminal domain-containing protein [Actinomycetales bacterium]|nr:TrkA C-terminal domain-containing protein [Actinomycetales bacterium]